MTTTEQPNRTERVVARLTVKEKETFKWAANVSQVSVSEYLRQSGMKCAGELHRSTSAESWRPKQHTERITEWLDR